MSTHLITSLILPLFFLSYYSSRPTTCAITTHFSTESCRARALLRRALVCVCVCLVGGCTIVRRSQVVSSSPTTARTAQTQGGYWPEHRREGQCGGGVRPTSKKLFFFFEVPPSFSKSGQKVFFFLTFCAGVGVALFVGEGRGSPHPKGGRGEGGNDIRHPLVTSTREAVVDARARRGARRSDHGD